MSDDLSSNQRLATYGTLAPGRANHGQLSALAGAWHKGWVFGHLKNAGWGAGMGYPGIILDPDAARVDVDYFESAELPDHWERLDRFEGEGYRRTEVQVHTNDGQKTAWIYVLADREQNL